MHRCPGSPGALDHQVRLTTLWQLRNFALLFAYALQVTMSFNISPLIVVNQGVFLFAL